MSYSLAFSQSLFIMVFVASKIEQKKFEFISTQQIAEKMNIPPSTSSVILRRLKKAGLIEAREGVNGGVRLAKLPEKISVLDIFEAVEQSGSMFPTYLNVVTDDEKAIRARQGILNVLTDAEEAMKRSLGEVTVKDLMDIVRS